MGSRSETNALDDAAFDASLSEAARRASPMYWTPVAVARRAADWLAALGRSRVLDVGSGAGKFCVVAALGTELRFTGVERRPHLVAEARGLAAELGVAHRVDFVCGTLADVDTSRFDALYVFNPFSEHLYPAEARLDGSVEHSLERMASDVAALEDALDALARGAVLVTYDGFRGAIPDTFDLVRWEHIGDSVLRAWVKRRVARGGRRWVEVGDDLTLAPDDTETD